MGDIRMNARISLPNSFFVVRLSFFIDVCSRFTPDYKSLYDITFSHRDLISPLVESDVITMYMTAPIHGSVPIRICSETHFVMKR